MAQITFEVDGERLFPRMEWGALVKAAAGFSCERCGATDCRLHAHHRNHDPEDNRLENGECLCVPCHSSHHRKTQCVFRDTEVQRELNGRITIEAKRASMRLVLEQRTPEKRAADGVRMSAFNAALTPEERSARASKGWETRRERYGDTHCKYGHPWTAENEGRSARGHRYCKTCQRESSRERMREVRRRAREAR